MKLRAFTGLAWLALTACIPHEQKVQGTLDNRSDYPARMTLELSSSSVEDGCDPDTSSRTKEIAVAAGEEESATLTWTCNYDVNPHVRYTLDRGVEAGKPRANEFTLHLGNYLESPLAPGEMVFWVDEAGVAQGVAIGEEPLFERGDGADLPDTEALLESPVRTDGALLQMFFPPETKVTQFGVATDRFKPAAEYDAVNRYGSDKNGVKFFKVYGHGVSGAVSGDVQESSARIVCFNDGCTVE